MTPDRFADRLEAAAYEGDEVMGVFESDLGESDSLWLSERLFRRLTAVADGCELHTLPKLGGSDPVRLNQQRCQWLLDELAFVAEPVDDPHLAGLYLAEDLRHLLGGHGPSPPQQR